MGPLRRCWKRYYFREMVIYALACCLFFNIPIVLATPTNPNQAAGELIGGISTSGNTTTVNMGSSGQAVINWDSLDTNLSEVLEFVKASGNFAVLNRIIQGGATQFDGSLLGNQGAIFIVVLFSAPVPMCRPAS